MSEEITINDEMFMWICLVVAIVFTCLWAVFLAYEGIAPDVAVAFTLVGIVMGVFWLLAIATAGIMHEKGKKKEK